MYTTNLHWIYSACFNDLLMFMEFMYTVFLPLLQRSASLPILLYGETLSEELGIDCDVSSMISLDEKKSRTAEDIDITTGIKVEFLIHIYCIMICQL